jgi:hypothetical protein
LLDELCVRYGYCLPPDEQVALAKQPPLDADAFVDAVLVAEGLDPGLIDMRRRRELVACVREWLFDDGRGKGTASRLP